MTAPLLPAISRPVAALLVLVTALLATALLRTIFPSHPGLPEIRFTLDAAAPPSESPAQPLFPGLPAAP